MNWLKRLFSKKKKSPGQKIYGPGRMVPEADYNLLKVIRLTMAEHGTFLVDGTTLDGESRDRADRCNAKALHDYYDMDQHEVLVATGIWLGEVEDNAGTSGRSQNRSERCKGGRRS